MRFLTLVLSISAAVSATPLGGGGWKGHGWHAPGAKAAYFLNDDPNGSSIVSLRVGSDNLLSDPVKTSTNGYGAIGTNLTGFPNTADALMSQSSVVVSGDVSSSESYAATGTSRAGRGDYTCVVVGETVAADSSLASVHRQRGQQYASHVSD